MELHGGVHQRKIATAAALISVRFVLRQLDWVLLLFCTAVVAGRRAGVLIRLFLGKIFRLQLTEPINGSVFLLSLFLADGAAPCRGAPGVTASSTSRPMCQCGGPSSALLRRSTLSYLQVVMSPAMASTAGASCVSMVERDPIAFPKI